MHQRTLIICFVLVLVCAMLESAGRSTGHKQPNELKGWDISATASALTEWTANAVLAERLNISARVLSVRDDGCHIDAGSADGVSVGQVFQIYRVQPGAAGGPEEITGEVQVAWTREDYSFAEPRGGLDMAEVTTLHFVRLVNIPPAVALLSDTSEGGGGPELDRLLQAIYGLLSVRGNTRPILGEPDEPAWRLVLTPDLEGFSISTSLSSPGGEISGTIVLDPLTGERHEPHRWLDPSYLNGASTPFEHYMAPPGRRAVRIACGNVIPGSADELAVLDGSDLWIYDLSWAEPRLMESLTVSIPPGPVRHRSDGGSLELADLDGDGMAEICLAPPGASRGEIWKLENDTWVLLEFLPYPPRAADSRIGGVIVAPWLTGSPALDPSSLQWVFPLSETESEILAVGSSLADITPIPEGGRDSRRAGNAASLPDLIGVSLDGSLILLPGRTESHQLNGEWGNSIEVAMTRDAPVILATAPVFHGDTLTLLNPYTGDILVEFASPGGPIIDIALGDIDRDSRIEILVAVLDEEGVRIYY